MEFRQLEYFCMIAKLENFTRAAEFLHVSQPSVTKAIKSLEVELKVTLIDRSQKHIMLTPEGKAFLIHAEKIVQAMEAAVQDMNRFQKNEQGELKLGIPPMIEGYLFPDIFTKFKMLYPKIELNILEYGASIEVQTKLEEGEIDLGIILGENAKHKNSQLIMQDQMSVCVHNAHGLKKESAVSFQQLKNETFILQQPSTHQYKEIYARCQEYGFEPNVLLSTAQLKTIKQLVANQAGISVLPNLVTHTETDFSTVQLKPAMIVNVLLIWSGNKYLSQASQSFVDFIKNYIKSADFQDFIHSYRSKSDER
ncbi:LysR family transcriptional regulator [Anaerosinus massiliensis]|uniref:LysR family transcriptional regulator n=1 Tax=Massilibacillus massiliensis TaxID=1806837 RepID=UPI000A6146B2|nr:LysR family transcriptional regulator [Massilibacillus massiliensis]